MGYEYNGPDFDELPEGLRSRIGEAVNATAETEASGIVVYKIESGSTEAGGLWKLLGDFREAFVYDFGYLHEAYFRADDDSIYRLFFCGSFSHDEMGRIEKALGLDVAIRPRRNYDEAKITINGDVLESLMELGHQPDDRITSLKYQLTASGPYMARR